MLTRTSPSWTVLGNTAVSWFGPLWMTVVAAMPSIVTVASDVNPRPEISTWWSVIGLTASTAGAVAVDRRRNLGSRPAAASLVFGMTPGPGLNGMSVLPPPSRKSVPTLSQM